MTATILRGVTVVDTRTGAVEGDLDVAVAEDRIAEVRRAGSSTLQGTVVDATGKYVVPGYVDMHTHVLGSGKHAGLAAELMLAHGITGFREMNSTPELLRQRGSGTLPLPTEGPRLLSLAGPFLMPLNASTPEAAVRTVREQKDLGADFIKVGLASEPVFLAAQAEAARVGLPYAGHLTSGIDVRRVSANGMRAIEHLGPGAALLAACSSDEQQIRDALNANPRRIPKLPPFKIPFLEALLRRRLHKLLMNPALNYGPAELEALMRGVATFDEDRAVGLADQMAKDGTWHCVTLIRDCTCMCSDEPRFHDDPNHKFVAAPTVEEWMDLDREFRALPPATRETLAGAYAIFLKMTRIFDQEGVGIVAGSDAGGIWDIPGPSLHQEFDEMARAGLSPLRVLQSATLRAAEFLGRTDVMGTVEAGKLADLVVLDADPTASVGALHRIEGVYRGRWWSAPDLAALQDRVQREKLKPLL